MGIFGNIWVFKMIVKYWFCAQLKSFFQEKLKIMVWNWRALSFICFWDNKDAYSSSIYIYASGYKDNSIDILFFHFLNCEVPDKL